MGQIQQGLRGCSYQEIAPSCGFSPISANTIKHLSQAEDATKGYHMDENNPFRLTILKINLHRDSGFDPSAPAFKLNALLNRIAGTPQHSLTTLGGLVTR